MKTKTRFILSIMLLTVLMIGGLSVVFIMAIMMGVDNVISPSKTVFLIVGVIITGISFKYMMQLNKKEESRRVDAVVQDHHEYLAQWEVKTGQWHRFLAERLSWEFQEAKGYGYTLGGILGVITAIVAFQHYALTMALTVTFSLACVGFLLGYAVTRLMAHKRYNKGRLFRTCEVYFAEELIVLNGDLIQLTDFGVKLRKVELYEKFDMRVLSFRIQTGIGNRKSIKQHWVPVPEDMILEGQRLFNHYQSLESV